jgi:hypothetical protein
MLADAWHWCPEQVAQLTMYQVRVLLADQQQLKTGQYHGLSNMKAVKDTLADPRKTLQILGYRMAPPW